jgi:RNA polymerase sigma factor (TIGR02999 family)
MPEEEADRLTRLLRAGDESAAAQLLPLVYAQLRAIAVQRLAHERHDHTLQATALVHEAYLRMFGDRDMAWNDRAHFFHMAAESMRRLLIEHARRRGRIKRGGDRRREPLNVLDLAADQDETQIVALDEAVRRLEGVDPAAAEVVRLRFFAGLSVEHAAAALNVSPRTIKRDWAFARAWLHRALETSP